MWWVLLLGAAAAGGAGVPHRRSVRVTSARLKGGADATPACDDAFAQTVHSFERGDAAEGLRAFRRVLAADAAAAFPAPPPIPAPPHVARRITAAPLEGSAVSDTECLRPAGSNPDGTAGEELPSRGYKVYGRDLLRLQLEPGRVCPAECSERCGVRSWDLNLADGFVEELREHADVVLGASGRYDRLIAVNPQSGARDKLGAGDSARHGSLRGHLLFLRVLELIRRAITSVFDLPDKALRVSTHSTFLRRVTDQDTGHRHLHADQSSNATYQYSGVLYLSQEGVDHEGGELRMLGVGPNTSPHPRMDVSPRRGRIVVFSGGWENPHQVLPVTAGTRYAISLFARVVGGPRPDSDDDAQAFQTACVQARPNSRSLPACDAGWVRWLG